MPFSLTWQPFPAPDGPLTHARVPWDSELFGFPVYEIRCGDAAPGVLDARLPAGLAGLAGAPCLAVAGLRPDAVAQAAVLTRHGFYPVETILTIELPLHRFRPLAGGRFRAVRFRPASAADLPALEAIARGAFATDRFHLDPHLPPGKADARYARWIRTSFEAGEDLFVLEAFGGESLLGFVLARRPAPGTYDVTLAATDPRLRHSGAGLALYQAMLAESVRRGIRRVLASISINNLDSLKVAERLGFTALNATAKFHWFRGPSPAIP